MEQAVADAIKGLDPDQQTKIPIVCSRANRKPWLVTARLDDLPRLVVQLYLTLFENR